MGEVADDRALEADRLEGVGGDDAEAEDFLAEGGAALRLEDDFVER